jgi:hypothetical protein
VSFLDRLERVFGRFAIPNLSLCLVIGQVGVYLALMLGRLDQEWFVFVPQAVLAGQWWRLLTFLLNPPSASPIFIAFAWWIFFLMGSALESYWGAFRYNLFLLLGYVLTVGLAFLTPAWPVKNGFLAGSVFLAFAYLNPNFELAIFFILPVKIKWLALLTWVLFAYQFVVGGLPARLQIIAAVGNFFIFFSNDIRLGFKQRRRRMTGEAARLASVTVAGLPRHRCRTCGRTDLSNPELDFRYCSKCAGDQCYCSEHIFTHVHLAEPP